MTTQFSDLHILPHPSRDFLFEAKVLQLPPDSPIGAGLQVEVHTALSYQDPTMVFPPSDSSRFFAIPGTSSRLPGEKYLRSTSRINSNSNDNINRNTYSSRSSASSCSEELGNGKGGDAIGDGECDARSLVRDVLALCADLKLTILVHRLAVTIGTLSGSFQSVRYSSCVCARFVLLLSVLLMVNG